MLTFFKKIFVWWNQETLENKIIPSYSEKMLEKTNLKQILRK